jgi:RNA polymerase sigma factor (sigma-70 family)
MNISIHLPVTGTGMAAQDDLYVLIKDCIAESKSAQKKLYERFAPMAYGVIKRYMSHDEGACQELLNDCFYKVFTKLDKYTFQGSFEGWIRRLVVNTVTDHLRKKIKDTRQQKEMKPDDAYIDSDSIEKISHKELLNMIETIPDTHRMIFNLFVFENYSHKEIASLLNMSENNCRWHLNDARRRLKEKLKPFIK